MNRFLKKQISIVANIFTVQLGIDLIVAAATSQSWSIWRLFQSSYFWFFWGFYVTFTLIGLGLSNIWRKKKSESARIQKIRLILRKENQ